MSEADRVVNELSQLAQECAEDRRRALKLADAFTLETQTCAEAIQALCEMIVAARADRDELRETLGKVAALYNGFVNGEPAPDWAADQVLAAIGAALGPPWQDSPGDAQADRIGRAFFAALAKHERPGGLVSPTAKPEPIGTGAYTCVACHSDCRCDTCGAPCTALCDEAAPGYGHEYMVGGKPCG